MTNEDNKDIEGSAAAEDSVEKQNETAITPEEQTTSAEEPEIISSGAAESAPGPEITAAAETIDSPPAAEPSETRSETESAATATAPQKETAATEEQTAPADLDFGAILEQYEQEQTAFHTGETVEGKVVGISERGVLVDFGYKSEGIVSPEEFVAADGSTGVNVGDTVEVVIKSMHPGDAPPQLSRADALVRKAWSDLEEAFKHEAAIRGRVIEKTKGGLKIDVDGIEAFMPGSQIDSRPGRSLDAYIGEEIEARIIKFSRRRNNVVLSRKVITDEVVNLQKAETLSKIGTGYIVDGTIKNLTEYGAFVDIGGIDGLLHVTDMSWGRIQNPGEIFKSGDHVQVKILKLDREKDKISLGYKQLLPDPWSTVVEMYHIDSRVTGKVSSATDYGIFVELEPGVEGLVHVSEISWSKRAQNPKRVYRKGQEVEVQVLGVDTEEKRISLGMKQLQENPWAYVDQRFPVGSKVHGRVRNITDFGAFVELEEGIDGLVHISDITWAKKIKHPKELLKKDQEVDAVVTNIDKAGQRLSLSMKDLTPSAWEGFVATHRPGDVVRGKVSRFTSFGIFVELGEALEGLCHISELSDERVERAEDVAQLGQEMDFKILRIEPADQKIGLSHRAVGKDDTPIVDTKIYSTEAKGGMASLAELANLKLGTAAAPSPQTAEEPKKEKKKGRPKKEAAAAEADAQAETLAVASVSSTESVPATESVPSTADETSETAKSETAEETSAEKASESVSESETKEAGVEEPAAQITESETASDESGETTEESEKKQPRQANSLSYT